MIKNLKNKTKNEIGITLIALIITIIVLLILAGVTINLTLGENGIFRTAEMAGKNYMDTQDKELAGLADFENTINNIVGGTGNSGTDEPVTNYETLKSIAKPGDYVKYIPTAKSFNMTPEQTGQNENQTFNTGDYTGLWQVLYNDETYGLQIISADIVGSLTLGHEDSDGDENIRTAEDEEKVIRAYNNAINTLNNFCRNYVDTRYATSGRSVGSNPINPDYDVTDTVTLSFTPNGYENGNLGLKTFDMNYETDYNAMEIANSQNTNGIRRASKWYWLASRYINSYEGYATFYMRIIYENGSLDNAYLWYIYKDKRSLPEKRTGGVRPVVTLKQEIKANTGDGSEDSPFELVGL